ncbi:hypothetical protein [Nocardia sp. NPDC004415]
MSDRTAELGWRVGRSTIADLEAGRRAKLEVPELIVLAEALGVPPAVLLYPDTLDGAAEVEYLPGERHPARWARERFAGEFPALYPAANVENLRLAQQEKVLTHELRLRERAYHAAARNLEHLPEGEDRKSFEDLITMAAVVVEDLRGELMVLRHRFANPSTDASSPEDGEA